MPLFGQGKLSCLASPVELYRLAPNCWSKTGGDQPVAVLLRAAGIFGIGRFPVQDFGAWIVGIDPHSLVELEGLCAM